MLHIIGLLEVHDTINVFLICGASLLFACSIRKTLVQLLSPTNHEFDFIPRILMKEMKESKSLTDSGYSWKVKFTISFMPYWPFWLLKGRIVTIMVTCPNDFLLDSIGVTWGKYGESEEGGRKKCSFDIIPASKNYKTEIVFCRNIVNQHDNHHSQPKQEDNAEFYFYVGSPARRSFAGKFTSHAP